MVADLHLVGTEAPQLRDVEIEHALLAALFHKNALWHRIADTLKPEHFGWAIHGRLYDAMSRVIAEGRTASPPGLRPLIEEDFASDPDPKAANRWLAQLVTRGLVSTYGPQIEDYARQIRELAERRALRYAGEALIADVEDIAADRLPAAIADDAQNFIYEAVKRADPGSGMVDFQQAMMRALEEAEAVHKADGQVIGVPSGLVDLDRALGGLHPTDLIVIAGRPGMGKTAAGTTISHGAALAGRRVAFFSLEMSTSQLAARMIAGECGISADQQRKGPLGHLEMTRLIDAEQALRDLPIWIDDTPAASVAQLRGRAIRLKRSRGLDLVVVDYLQLLIGPQAENRVQELSKITRDLKMTAKELGIPVVALAQLSRAVESRDDKRPMLSDLRDSGSIEQDADVVIFPFREEHYLKRQEPTQKPDEGLDRYNGRMADWKARMSACRGLAHLIIGKNRHGPEHDIKVRFSAELTRFENLARSQQDDRGHLV